MEANNTVELTTQVLPANASNNIVKYTSTNTKVAKVDQNTGLVTLVGAGEAKIYARLTEKDELGQTKENGNFEVSCAVRVRFKPESITTDKDSVTIIEPERDSSNSPVITDVNKALVSANVGTVNAYDRSVKWEITDEKVANVKG
ncbi:MAG: Ig-like domain-containing protein, partial [Bacteroidales bacterium]|nr:Ig-like domain-containing protein [Bacteroidales bacterium]